MLAITGGKTSHAAIIAKGQNLTYISGVPKELMELQDGAEILMDGSTGKVFLEPTPEILEEYKKKSEEELSLRVLHEKLKNSAGISKDGIERKASTNIAGLDDMEAVLESGAEGIALFRTEFLFLKRDSLPTEEEQYEVYYKVAEAMNGKSVIVRTMDIGGDKGAERFFTEKEENPLLGLRGIRFAFEREEMFITQLRALLRAATLGNIKIMFPMIGRLEDLLRGKEILEKAKESLRAENISFKEDLSVGIMMEVPSAALLAEVLAEECDFFSISTNDLMQYTMAADRMNQTVREWNDPYNPGFLKIVEMLVKGCLSKGVHTGICGDLAGDENLIPFWNAIGIEEYGVAAAGVGALKYAPANSYALNQEDWVRLVLNSRTSAEVLEKLKAHRGSI